MVAEYTHPSQQPRIRRMTVQGVDVIIVDVTTASNYENPTSDTYSCPGPWCPGSGNCNCRRYTQHYPYHDTEKWEAGLKKILAMGDKFREDFKTAFRGGLIPHKGYGGILPPIQRLAPPLTTAAPALDDRRRDIRAFMTVRPTRVP